MCVYLWCSVPLLLLPLSPQVIKYSKDTRYDNECASTHDLQKCAAVGCTNLSELSDEMLQQVDVIGMDEAQFMTGAVEFAERWANAGKVVIVAALDATFERKPFGRMLELVPLAEQVQKLNAVCMLCHREASFTKRIGSETAVEVIGGSDMYLSTCRACFALRAHSPTTAMAERARIAQERAQAQAEQLRQHMESMAAATASPASAASPAAAASVSASSSPAPLSLLPCPAACDSDDELLLPSPNAATVAPAAAPCASNSLSSNKRVSVPAAVADSDSAAPLKPSHKRKHTAHVADVGADAVSKKQLVALDATNKENAAC